MHRVTSQRTRRLLASYAVNFLILISVLFSMPALAAVEKIADSRPVVQREPVLSTPKVYPIGAEDVLDISVWGESELSKVLVVSPDGKINYPLLGELVVDGMTTQVLEEDIKNRLSQGFLKDPRVTVSVKEFNSKKILVFGLVGAPGLYKVRGELPLLELLFMAGNVTHESGNKLVIMRKDPNNAQVKEPVPVVDFNLDDLLLRGDLSRNILVKPGDVVYVTGSAIDKRRFYVMGQVKEPGPYDFARAVTLLEAIKIAGGLTEYAAPRRIQVIRREGEKKITLKININEIIKGKKADDFMVQAGDVIVVPESWF